MFPFNTQASNTSKDDDIGIDLLINSKNIGSSSPKARSRSASVKSLRLEKIENDDMLSSSSSSEIEIVMNNSPESPHSHTKKHNVALSVSDNSESSSSSLWEPTHAQPPRPQPTQSPEDIMNTKREILYQFARLEKKGIQVPKKFSLSSSLEEMKSEYDRLKRDMEVDASVRFQRRMLMACVSGVEFLNHRFDPFNIQLDGWSETVQDGINDYDDIFEELWEKYHAKVKMAPELRLIFTLGGSAIWFHMSNSMFKTMPGVEQVLNANPELKKQFMAATMSAMNQPASQQPSSPPPQQNTGLFGGLGNLMGGLFGGGGGGGASMPPPTAAGVRPSMRGPTDVDDILNELHQQNFNQTDDIEVFSTMSGGISEDDALSMSGLLQEKGKRKKRRTLELG